MRQPPESDGSFCFEVQETGAAHNFRDAAQALRLRRLGAIQGLFEDATDAVSGRVGGHLGHEAYAGALANGDVTFIRQYATEKHFEQSGFAGAIGADQANAFAFTYGER